ncbi:MAG: MBL fold metallo-hydrolase [Nitrospirota bacterium]|nr:MBL fold metallo-hydrolase [Nitrospirota bacterium]
MILRQLQVGSIGNFNYLIGDPDSRTAALVDPAWEPERLLGEAGKLGLTVTHILLTHCHSDHVQANGPVKDATGAAIHVHRAEFPYLKHFLPPPGDVAMEDGGSVRIGSLEVRWLHTPGHSPGSSCLWVENALITGDTLFVNSIGRTDFPGSDPREMFASIRKLRALPDHLTIYPGHHYGPTPTSTIGEQKRHNRFWQVDTVEEFLAMTQPDNDIL